MRKNRNYAIALLAAVLVMSLVSCHVVSVHPFYKDDDLTYDKNLVGLWRADDSGKDTMLLIQGDPEHKTYSIIHYEQNKADVYTAHLFEISNIRVLDVLPVSPPNKNGNDLTVTAHGLWKVQMGTEDLKLFAMNQPKTEQVANQDAVAFLKDSDGRVILTAQTEDLKFLVSRHLDVIFDGEPMLSVRKEKK